MQMRDKICGLSISDLKQDIVFYFGLYTCTFVPFIAPFPELCIEVGQHYQKGERLLRDIKGNVIMDFSPDAIRTTFQWTTEGDFEYGEAESLLCYQSTNQPTVTIRSWMFDEHCNLKGNPLINAPRSNFFPKVELIILMFSRILGKEDASRFKEFFSFITEIAKGRRIKWSKVLSDTIAEQLSSMGTSRRFYLNSCLVYLLLHGKYRPTVLGESSWVQKGTYAIWKCYPKWKIARRWDSFTMRNDGWEYQIYKEIKGEVAVARISNSAQDTLRKHGDFFVQHQDYSYIRIYRSIVEPYRLSRYVSNKLLLMEMMRQLAHLHENVWQKKSTTSNLSIVVGEYQCKAWTDVDSMKEELRRYNFHKMNPVSHYDPEHKSMVFI